jgi:hypothetical protein
MKEDVYNLPGITTSCWNPFLRLATVVSKGDAGIFKGKLSEAQ